MNHGQILRDFHVISFDFTNMVQQPVLLWCLDAIWMLILHNNIHCISHAFIFKKQFFLIVKMIKK